MPRLKPYIHQKADWPQFTWRSNELLPLLSNVRNMQGRLIGRMENLGFDLRNEALLDTFDRMINCDILIMSRSSLSACASYLKNGISLYHPFWHNMMKRDIAYNDSHFESRLIEYITTLNNFPKNKNSGT